MMADQYGGFLPDIDIDDGDRKVKTYLPNKEDPVSVHINVFEQDNVANVKANIFTQHSPTLIPENYVMICVVEGQEFVMMDERGLKRYTHLLEVGTLKFILRSQT